MQIRAAFRGSKQQNDTAWLVGEYISRKRLAKLGFTQDISQLPAWKSEVFCLIDSELEKLEADEAKKRSRKNGR